MVNTIIAITTALILINGWSCLIIVDFVTADELIVTSDRHCELLIVIID